jgi:hypothetical protein
MGIITLTKHPQNIDKSVLPETGAGAPEVTPEMIEAGVIALELYREAFGDPQLVQAIYTAMHGRRSH